ncbi:hypothetical protein GCM10009872_23550 [Actinopolymorpha rutila]
MCRTAGTLREVPAFGMAAVCGVALTLVAGHPYPDMSVVGLCDLGRSRLALVLVEITWFRPRKNGRDFSAVRSKGPRAHVTTTNAISEPSTR